MPDLLDDDPGRPPRRPAGRERCLASGRLFLYNDVWVVRWSRATLDAQAKAHRAASAALEKHADDVVILQVGPLTTIADFFVICSGESPRQVNAVAEGIDAVLSREGIQPFHVEGTEHANWVLMDYSDVIVHIFKPEIRAFYALERLWGDASKVAVTDRMKHRGA